MAHLPQAVGNVLMAVQMQRALIAAALHAVTNHAQHPNSAQHVVGVAVRQKDVMHLIDANAQFFQVGQHAAAAAGVNHKVFPSV